MMPEAETRIVEPETTTHRPMRVFLMRHAEPKVYGDKKSKLSGVGKKQVEDKARELYGILRDGNPHEVRIVYSSRPRTAQTGRRLQREFRRLIQNDGNTDLVLAKPHEEPVLQTARPLNQLSKHSVPREQLYSQWTTLPEEELRRMGVATPSMVREDLSLYLRDLDRQSREMEPGREIDIIAVTHEPSLHVFQSELFPHLQEKPQYGEFMVIDLGRPEGIRFSFRGEEVLVNG
jgi:hypothetical protein